jgi:CheY-like chemotaxis protein
MAQSVALVIHELATNGAKYGALKSPRGRVAMAWQLIDGSLHLEWVESGGPKCTPPATNGFGSKMIKATIENQLRGALNFDWNPEGLRCTFSFPLHDEEFAAPHPSAPGQVRNLRRGGRKVLLVEDEAMVALMMSDFISELGFEVVGPYAKVSEAMAAVQADVLDAAVLDINLNGEMVYPVADALKAKKVPFVFVSGYALDGMDQRFSSVPVFQKPVEWAELRKLLVQTLEVKPELLRASAS